MKKNRLSIVISALTIALFMITACGPAATCDVRHTADPECPNKCNLPAGHMAKDSSWHMDIAGHSYP